MAEWFKAPVLKTGVRAIVPWVQIPPHPLLHFLLAHLRVSVSYLSLRHTRSWADIGKLSDQDTSTRIMNPSELPRPEPPVKPARFQDAALVQNKFAVLAVLFFVTGFLGLPLLWICRNFSNTERWIWAVLNTLYTCTLIWIVAKICMWSWNQISQAF